MTTAATAASMGAIPAAPLPWVLVCQEGPQVLRHELHDNGNSSVHQGPTTATLHDVVAGESPEPVQLLQNTGPLIRLTTALCQLHRHFLLPSRCAEDGLVHLLHAVSISSQQNWISGKPLGSQNQCGRLYSTSRK